MAIEAVNMAWWEMNIVTGEVFFHKRKTDILGYRQEDFKHYRDFMALVHPDDYEPAMEAMRNHFKGTTPTYETEYRIRNQWGDYKWFYDKGAIVSRDENGKPLKIIGFVIDITHQKEIEQTIRDLNASLEKKIEERTAELVEANRAKSELLSRMSHELRTPLNSILGFAQLLQMGQLNPVQEKNIGNILAAGKLFLELVNEVLEINEMETGLLKFELIPVDVLKPIRNSVEALREFAAMKKVSVTINPTSPGFVVLADETKVELVLKNLIDNAIRYNKPDGNVSLKLARIKEEGQEWITLIISDTGCGIEPQYLPRLFNPFERIGIQKPDQGVGLGLAFAKKVINAMGGRIRVESTVDAGSSFIVDLPASEV
jgi:PAS domain S-box-containing protein